MRNYIAISFFAVLLLSSAAAGAEPMTREAALEIIGESQRYTSELADAGYGVGYFQDLIDLETKVFERADLAEKIRKNSTGSLSSTTLRALMVLDYEKFQYGDVMEHYSSLRSRYDRTYEISDSIYALGKRISDYPEFANASGHLESARSAFAQEKYDEAELFVQNGNAALDDDLARASNMNLIASRGYGFFEGRKYETIAFVILSCLVGAFSWSFLKKRKLEAKVRSMKFEKKVLQNLMKDIQIRRFEKSSMSKSSYEIRVRKYRERLREIGRALPILESKSKNLSKTIRKAGTGKRL
ncbi:MAG: hypothetical protein HY833_03820 [Candidatus Aenigmarchaeota archaeon]|nr:hypothetical protein [Candidatus Aenigmarchaeota archaeon]